MGSPEFMLMPEIPRGEACTCAGRPRVNYLAILSALFAIGSEVALLVYGMSEYPPGAGNAWILGVVLSALAALFGTVALDRFVQHPGRLCGRAFAMFGTLEFLVMMVISLRAYERDLYALIEIPKVIVVPMIITTAGVGLLWGTIDLLLTRRTPPRVSSAKRTTASPGDAAEPTAGDATPGEAEGLPPAPRLSGLAVASLVCGILVFTTLGGTALPGLICGGAALWQIWQSRGRLWGNGFAAWGLVLSCSFFYVLAAYTR